MFSQQGSLAVAGGMIVPLSANGSEMHTPVVNGTVQSSPERLAMYQEESARGVVCRICPNEWTLKEGEVSHNDNSDEIRLMCRWLFSNGFADTPLTSTGFSPSTSSGIFPLWVMFPVQDQMTRCVRDAVRKWSREPDSMYYRIKLPVANAHSGL